MTQIRPAYFPEWQPKRINPNHNNHKRDAHKLGKQIAYVVFILNEVNQIKK